MFVHLPGEKGKSHGSTNSLCGKNGMPLISNEPKRITCQKCMLIAGYACPTPKKIVYESRRDAVQALKETQKKSRVKVSLGNMPELRGLRPYECSCGKFHLGHRD